jgi:phage host-nuclease inhibitor protein Gam
LEERIDGEIDTIGEKTKVDRQERLLAQQDLEHEIKGLKNELNNRLTQMDEQFSKEVKNLRQQTLNKFQELALQLRQQNDSLTNLFNQEVAQLQEEKVNRADLAFFFNEIAVRLTKNYEGSSELE